jgi:hypothetical protein
MAQLLFQDRAAFINSLKWDTNPLVRDGIRLEEKWILLARDFSPKGRLEEAVKWSRFQVNGNPIISQEAPSSPWIKDTAPGRVAETHGAEIPCKHRLLLIREIICLILSLLSTVLTGVETV